MRRDIFVYDVLRTLGLTENADMVWLYIRSQCRFQQVPRVEYMQKDKNNDPEESEISILPYHPPFGRKGADGVSPSPTHSPGMVGASGAD